MDILHWQGVLSVFNGTACNAGAQSAQPSLTPQQLEQQRVRAAIFSQTSSSQGPQQPGYAHDSRYPASSLPPLHQNTGGRTPALIGLADLFKVMAVSIQPDIYLASLSMQRPSYDVILAT